MTRIAQLNGNKCALGAALFVFLVSMDACLNGAEVDYILFQKTFPLIQTRCFGCHGDDPKQIKGKLDLRTRAGMLKGGASGEPSLVPGQPEKSPLYQGLTWADPDFQMPPKENQRFSQAEMKLVHDWITAGAPWPDKTGAKQAPATSVMGIDKIAVATSGGQSPDWSNRIYDRGDLWAYMPVRNISVPGSKNDHPIDAFLNTKMAARNIRAAPPAEARALVRRAFYNLTGLPPTAADIEQYTNDTRRDRWERLLDRLLSAPQYGERMAQHWLDVVRYADTDGFANDYERPNAWRYRDYVIRSFNSDKPFDRFIIEQIAGDEALPQDSEARMATGFLRMGPWEKTAMTVDAAVRQQWLDDVTNSVGVTFLGHGLSCARCHDHKFDPVPTRDYYAVQAVFATTIFDRAKTPFIPAEQASQWKASKAVVESHSQKLGLKPVSDKNAGGDSFMRISQKRSEYFQRALSRYEPLAYSVKGGPEVTTYILTGGSLESPGEAVRPGVLSAAVRLGGSTATAELTPEKSGRRLALANWIADSSNPLTARVIVNRVWQWHFGRGLVSTPNNFGKMGARPSNPELLDFLASWFVQNERSIKKLHRLIMTSAAYQRSTEHPDAAALAQTDPQNLLLAYFSPRRLTAEEIRDAMLAASGELNLEPGGPGVFPEIEWEVALQPRHIMGGIAPSYLPSPTPEQRNRRSIYAFRYRGLPDPAQDVFNRPNADLSCEKRDETTVTPQVFALFNSTASLSRALSLAKSIINTGTIDDQIRSAFLRVYARSPIPTELIAGKTHVESMLKHHRAATFERMQIPNSVVRTMIAEQTGELFKWEELLDLSDYISDPSLADVSPEVRALAELCLVLMNSNEFLYLY